MSCCRGKDFQDTGRQRQELMLRYPQLVREVRRRIREATDQTILEIGEHDEQEPVITASLVRGIRESLGGMHRNGVRVTAQVLSDRGR